MLEARLLCYSDPAFINDFPVKPGINKLIILAVAVIVIGGTAYFTMRLDSTPTRAPDIGTSGLADEPAMAEDSAAAAPEEAADTTADGYEGQRLAGPDEAPLLAFTESDYRKALTEKKYIVLYFYANWCPICRAEFPMAEAAFDSLETNDIIGFRVNFNDSETDEFEEALAREFGVAYQHTKVILQDGTRILKSPESWDRARYDEELSKLR